MNKYIVLFFMLSQIVSAQYNISAKIKPVSKSGTYQIVLPTKIASASKENFSDLRIFDSKNKEVPYIFLENVLGAKSTKIDFKIINRTAETKKRSSLIFENNIQTLDFINLEIANYSGSKTFTVAGSNDQKQWFGVLEPTILDDLNGNNLSVFKTINFPKTNYKFLKIETVDKNSLPINILKVQQIGLLYGEQNFEKILPKSIQIKQFLSEKKTKIFVEFESSELIDKLEFDIKLPSNYKRNIRLYENIVSKKKRKSVINEVEFANFELTPNSNKNIDLEGKRSQKFVIEIDNLDNSPLEINQINFYQETITIATSLNANENYTLKSDNFESIMPQYDISNIETTNLENLPKATVLEVVQKQNNIQKKSDKQFWNSPIFLWISIGIATIVVLFFVFGLLKDLKKST